MGRCPECCDRGKSLRSDEVRLRQTSAVRSLDSQWGQEALSSKHASQTLHSVIDLPFGGLVDPPLGVTPDVQQEAPLHCLPIIG
jgi:hypothetical protein